MFQDHPYLPKILTPGTVTKMGLRRTVTINSLGFRGREIAQEKPKNGYRIICLGGSTTFGTGPLKEENNWPDQLERLLQAEYKQRQIEVINAGVPGYTTADSLINLELRLLDLSPDLIIINHLSNDLSKNGFKDFKPDYSHVYQSYKGLSYYLDRYYRFYLFIFTQAANRFIPGYVKESNYLQREIERSDHADERGVSVFKRNLEHMILIARKHNIKVMLITYPKAFDKTMPLEEQKRWSNEALYFHPALTLEGLYDGFSRYNDTIMDLAKENETYLVDLAGGISPGGKNFVDSVHFNDEGAREVAKIINESIIGSRLIE